MSEIISLQQRFAVQSSRMILAADSRGIGLRYSHAWRDPRVYKIIDWAFANGYSDGLPKPKCHPRSLHFDRLAIDLVAEEEKSFSELHDLWDAMDDNSAPRIEGDYGHFSFGHNGMT